ncbi:hypothetical protein [Arsenicicoccus piscis]|uniref:hypothetical protein n=1 Tax=Arsenicicoccus piscis TaxID=673954 RepID=UPI0030C659A3
MPEGHTIHAIAGRIEHAFGGTRPEVSSPQGRFAESAALLQGRELVSASAAGKHLTSSSPGTPSSTSTSA